MIFQKWGGVDLEIANKEDYCYMLTYSFPCQDLSLAGKTMGMEEGSETRSSLLWQVGRILRELKEQDSLPQVLLMENVPQVHGTSNIENFRKWISTLEKLGYQNYWQDLKGTDYGIPQLRNRTFMVSIVDAYYEFPKPMKLEKRLKDLLEEEVDEKYYISDKMANYIYSDTNAGKYNRKAARECADKNIEKGLAVSITTHRGGATNR